MEGCGNLQDTGVVLRVNRTFSFIQAKHFEPIWGLKKDYNLSSHSDDLVGSLLLRQDSSSSSSSPPVPSKSSSVSSRRAASSSRSKVSVNDSLVKDQKDTDSDEPLINTSASARRVAAKRPSPKASARAKSREDTPCLKKARIDEVSASKERREVVGAEGKGEEQPLEYVVQEDVILEEVSATIGAAVDEVIAAEEEEKKALRAGDDGVESDGEQQSEGERLQNSPSFRSSPNIFSFPSH